MGWWLLGGFLLYTWFLNQNSGGGVKGVLTTLKNDLSNFQAVNTAGLPTGAISNPGVSPTFPGSTGTPTGIQTAVPGSYLPAPTGGVPVGATMVGAPIPRRGPMLPYGFLAGKSSQLKAVPQ